MGLFDGKKGLILGVANDHSIAWAVAQKIMAEGGLCGFSHLPDRPDDERQRNRRRVALLTEKCEAASFLVPMDVSKDEDIKAVMDHAHCPVCGGDQAPRLSLLVQIKLARG